MTTAAEDKALKVLSKVGVDVLTLQKVKHRNGCDSKV